MAPSFTLPQPTVPDVRQPASDHTAERADLAFAASLVASNSDGLGAVDREFRISEWNPVLARWTGIPRAQALGRRLEDVLPLDEETGRRERFLALFETGEPFTKVRRYHFQSVSDVMTIETVVSPIRDLTTGDITGALITIRDVGERLAADERFRVLFESSSDAHLLFDETGIIDCNEATIRMLRAESKEQILALHPAVLSPDVQPDGRASLEKSVEMDALARRHGHHRFDWMHRRLDGTDIPVEVSLTPVTLQGRPALLVVWHDLTWRLEAESAVRRERERLSDAVGALDSGFAMFDEQQRLVVHNPRFIRGAPFDGPPPALGTPLRTLLEGWLRDGRHPFSHEDGASWIERILALHNGDGGTYEESGPDGALRVSVSRTSDGGTVTLFTDISESKEIQASLEQARDAANESSRAKSAFLARMSHELRTPLNSIIGFSHQVLRHQQGVLSPRHQLYLERVAHNGTHLLSLINTILDLSKIESGRVHMTLTTVDVGALVQETVALLEGQPRGAGVMLRVAVPLHLLPIETDSGLLRQVLINLVGNAIKFTKAGSIDVEVVGDEGTRPRAIVVRDTGIGIPADRLGAIFESFEQASATTALDYGGTGLGLSISQSICSLLGATLGVESSVGAGSTFRISLPMTQ